MGFQMNTHAIGDSTVSVLLKEYQKVLNDIDDPRWRIEHSQVVDLNEFNLYNDKILPSVQPTHATSDMYWAYDRLGERIEGAYAFKDLLSSSKRIALGTDFPVERVNPFHTFYSSIERNDFIIIDQNIMEIEAAKIPNTKVLKTFVDGELVYQKDAL